MKGTAEKSTDRTRKNVEKVEKVKTETNGNELQKVKLTENSLQVLKARYLKKNEKGESTETPEELFHRVAAAVAAVEEDYTGGSKGAVTNYTQKYMKLMTSGKFMPNSPTLMNAGRRMGMLSACFVLPLDDSIDDIFSTVKATAMIQKAGGGTGFSFDKLRPTGDYINSSGGTTSGPISFWKVLSESTNAIQQGAFRRGANMGMMSLTHPDILKFVHAKQDLSKFTNFNISVKIPNAWMEAWGKTAEDPHVVINGRTGKTYVMPKSLDIENYQIQDLIPLENYRPKKNDNLPEVYSMNDLFEIIIDNAHRTGEPGIIFIDHINQSNPTPNVGLIEATNPCGEQPLLPYEACNLGSINLSLFVREEGGKTFVDWDDMRETIYTSTRFLDNIIDVNKYPLSEIAEMCKNNRKIGLGVMGFSDALYKLGIPYNSEAALDMAEQFMGAINDESHDASEELAKERGNFPNWEGSTWDVEAKRPMRNATTTTVAPTGTISIIAGCSGGIEPMFSLAFFRNVLEGQRMTEVNPIFEAAAKEGGYYSDQLIETVAKVGTLHNIKGIPAADKKVFVCAHDIEPDWHIRMQAAFQKHCDSSISKTINLPHTADTAAVKEVYVKAYKLGCKGVTVYRDGCRDAQPMALDNKKKEAVVIVPAAPKYPLKPVKTPDILSAVRIRQNTPFGHMHVTISVDPKTGRELEVFAQLGKAGDVAMSDLEAISRMVSLYLRIGGGMQQVINQLEGIGSHLSIPTKDGRVMSLADGLGKTLKRYMLARKQVGVKGILMGEVNLNNLGLKTGASQISPALQTTDGMNVAFKIKCPECSNNLAFVEGCQKCLACGFSKC